MNWPCYLELVNCVSALILGTKVEQHPSHAQRELHVGISVKQNKCVKICIMCKEMTLMV